MDSDITETFFGITVALYSLGQCISSPLFGWWSNRIQQVKQPLSVGIYLMLIGNIIYILMEVFTFPPRRYLMLIGRFINGLGSGNVAVLRTYASTASTTKDRSKAIAYVTCGQALGCVISLKLIFINF